MSQSTVTEEARGLPREPTSPAIMALFVGALVVWVAVLFWQVAALPSVFAIRFDFSGQPTSWWGKGSSLGLSVVLAAVLVAPALFTSPLLLRAPHLISAPNSHWWTATPRRLRRFERILREDLLLLAAACLLLLAIAEAGITVAANSTGGGMPPVVLVAMLVPLAGLVVVTARMIGAGGRYDSQPALDHE